MAHESFLTDIVVWVEMCTKYHRITADPCLLALR
jgi:hypothetical protein